MEGEGSRGGVAENGASDRGGELLLRSRRHRIIRLGARGEYAPRKRLWSTCNAALQTTSGLDGRERRARSSFPATRRHPPHPLSPTTVTTCAKIQPPPHQAPPSKNDQELSAEGAHRPYAAVAAYRSVDRPPPPGDSSRLELLTSARCRSGNATGACTTAFGITNAREDGLTRI